jgi:hypothetical protein
MTGAGSDEAAFDPAILFASGTLDPVPFAGLVASPAVEEGLPESAGGLPVQASDAVKRQIVRVSRAKRERIKTSSETDVWDEWLRVQTM